MISTAPDTGEHSWPARYAFTPDKRASTMVVEAVSKAANTAIEQLPILYEVVDPDALDALFRIRNESRGEFDGELSFAYAGYRVTVTNRTITVRPAD